MSTEGLPAWIIAFRKQFVDTGKVAPNFYDDLVEAYRLHEIADTSPELISPEIAEAMLKKTREFVAIAEEYLKARER